MAKDGMMSGKDCTKVIQIGQIQVKDGGIRELDDLRDALRAGDHTTRPIGMLLPMTFNRGWRWMKAKFLDACRIVEVFGNADLFITVTCNPRSPWILDALGNQSPDDRPDLVARGFRAMTKDIMHKIAVLRVFGRAVAIIAVFEFQVSSKPTKMH
eukprot:GHVU01124214.1.p1 GENE.GHVU01124214.1~~GHVU01124214.1.p1  ORF type:complete len:155 (+),score=9.42 GHVU01124214.1:2642-3106(+)